MRTASVIARMIKTVCTSETSVYFNKSTRLYKPEHCQLHTRHSENLKSHVYCPVCNGHPLVQNLKQINAVHTLILYILRLILILAHHPRLCLRDAWYLHFRFHN
jgi:hypothetical protein